MKNHRGNALLVVTLLSVGMVLMAMGLVSMSGMTQRTSAGLNDQVALRYAAESGLEEVKLRLYKDKNDNPAGNWFLPVFVNGLSASDKIQYTNNPTSGPYIAIAPGIQRTLGDVSTGIRELKVDVYFDKTANANEFVARVSAYLAAAVDNKLRVGYKMNFNYTSTTAIQPGLASFSKFAWFMDNWASTGSWFGNVRMNGYVHSNENVKFGSKLAQFKKEVTYVDKELYNGAWTQAQKDALFFEGRKQASPITMPSFNDIRNDLKPIAQVGNPNLYIDAASPTWSTAAPFDNASVNFVWDSTLNQNFAYISVSQGGVVKRTVKQLVPPGGADTLIYTELPVKVKGIVQGRVTMAAGNPSTNVANPSVLIQDDIVYVDDQGRPKMWTYQANGQPLPASGRTYYTDPVTGQQFRYQFNGIPTAGNPLVNNISTKDFAGAPANWDGSSYVFMQNPSYNPAFKPPCLGMMSDGKFGISSQAPYNTLQSWAMYSPSSIYEVQFDGTPRGNRGIHGACILSNSPIGGQMFSSTSWQGYCRNLNMTYDNEMLQDPPPYFVKIPSSAASSSSTTVTVSLGASYMTNSK